MKVYCLKMYLDDYGHLLINRLIRAKDSFSLFHLGTDGKITPYVIKLVNEMK